MLQKAVELNKHVKQEVYLIPHSYNELGELYMKQGKTAEAEEMLKKAKNFSRSYDFDKPLSRKIAKNLDVLHKEVQYWDGVAEVILFSFMPTLT